MDGSVVLEDVAAESRRPLCAECERVVEDNEQRQGDGLVFLSDVKLTGDRVHDACQTNGVHQKMLDVQEMVEEKWRLHGMNLKKLIE